MLSPFNNASTIAPNAVITLPPTTQSQGGTNSRVGVDFFVLPTANELFRPTVGILNVEMNDKNGVIYDDYVNFDVILQKSEVFENINTGGVRILKKDKPDFFYKPVEPSPMFIPIGRSKTLNINYKDKAFRLLGRSIINYDVLVQFSTLEQNEEFDALDETLKERILHDFLTIPTKLYNVDVDKYKNDPNYSLRDELDKQNGYDPLDYRFNYPVESKATRNPASDS